MKSLNLKSLFVFLVSVIVLLSLTACASSSDTDTDSSTGSDTATEVATEAPAATDVPAADVVAAFVFTNTGTIEICNLFLSPVDTNDWGPDQLGGATIPAGQQFTLKNIPAGKYDAKAVGCNGGGESTIVLDIHN